MLTGRRRALVGAFIAAMLGVTAVCLSTLLFASSRPRVPEAYRDAAVVARSPAANAPSADFVEPIPWPAATAAAYAERLSQISGVAATVPVRQFYAQPTRDGHAIAGATIGYGWSAAQLGGHRLGEGAAPRTDREVAVGPGLGARTGARITVLTATGPADYRVSGVVVNGGDGLWLSDRSAQALAPGVRAIGLRLAPGADVVAVADAARAVFGTGGEVLVGDRRTALEPRADARTRWIGMQLLTAVSALSGFVTVFVVAGTYAFSVAQRRREFALLRTLGATPRQVRRSLYAEALTVGAVASVTGTVLGALLAPLLVTPLVAAGAEPTGYAVRPVWWPIAVSLVIGPVLATAGAAAASWRASRVPPLDALRDAAVEERPMGRLRWAVGLLFAALGLLLVVLMATAGSMESLSNLVLFAAMALITAAAVLAPAVVPPLTRLVGALPSRSSGAIGMLVREGAATSPRRTASVAAPVLLTLSFAVLVSGLFATTTASYAARRTAAVEAGAVLAPDGTPGLSDAAVDAVRGSGNAVLLPSVAYTADREALQALGVDPAALAATDKRARALTELNGSDAAAVTQAAATRLGLAAGGTLWVTFADGTTARLHIATVVPDGIVPAELLLDRATLRAHDPGALTSAVLLPGAPGPVAPGTGGLGPRAPGTATPGLGARVVSVATWAGEQDAQDDRVAWTLVLLLMGVSAGYGALALVNTLLMAAGGRAADFRLLRRAGATPGQIGRAAAAEAVLVVTIGALLAAAITVPALLGIRAGLSEQMGADVPLVVPWGAIAGIVGGTLLLAVAAAAIPARRSLRAHSWRTA
jgi:putative ABC transport system permease protein